MKILLINLEFDCAGVAWNLAQAIRAHHPAHEVRHVAFRPTHAAPHSDLFFREVSELIPLCEWADVLHFNNWIWTHRPGNLGMDFVGENEYGCASPFEPFLRDKRVFFHWHGGPHQSRPQYWIDECARVGAKMFKCDPVTELPAKWMPNTLDIEPGARPDYRGEFRVAVYGALSDARRNNREIDEALKHLGIRGAFYGDVPRQQALSERAIYPATIDNLTQGFVGMWAWEALAMGQVVFSTLSPRAARSYRDILGGPPIVDTQNVFELSRQLSTLRTRRDLLEQIGQAGQAWTLKHNTPAESAARFLEEYAA